MKILQVITSMKIGGAEKLVLQLALMFKNEGYQCDVALFNGENTIFKRTLLEYGVKVFDFSYNNSYYSIGNILKLYKLMKNYDVVHTHNTAPQLFAAICKKYTSVLLYTTEHSTSNRRRRFRLFLFIDRWMYKQYDKIICISQQATYNLIQYLGFHKNIITIENGVDTKQFYNASPAQDLISNKKTIVMVAGFRYQKDQKTLIRAMGLLDRDKYELWLVGEGKLKSENEIYAKSLNVSENVKFLGLRYDIPNVLKAADIIVMSSHFEGLSLSNVEGMASGKPFIASNVDGLREVTNGYGLLFEHANAEDLAKKIMLLCEDEDFYKQIAVKCWERARMYDINKMFYKYKMIYKFN